MNQPSLKTIIPPVLGVLVIGGIAFAYTSTQTIPEPQAPEAQEGTMPEPVTSQDAAIATSSAVTTSGTKPTAAAAAVSASAYKNGTYSASASYMTPEGPETIAVTLTVTNDVVTDVTANVQATISDSRRYVNMFMSEYKAQVVGKSLASLKLGRVSGSSLTPQGFNDAVEQIRAQARS